MKFIRDSSLTIISQVLGTLLGVASSIVVARAFRPEGRGLYALLLLSIMAISLVTNLGLGPAAVFLTGQKQITTRASASLLLTASLGIGALTAAVLVSAAILSGKPSIGEIPTAYWVVIATLAPFYLARRYAGYFFVALSDFAWYNYLNLLELGTRFLAILGMFAILETNQISILAGVVLSVVIPPVLAWLRIGRRVQGIPLGAQTACVRKFGSYGIRFYLADLIPFLSLRVDQFLVGFLLGIADVGLYAAAVSIAEILRMVALAVSVVLFGRVASLDQDAATNLTGRTSRVSMTLSLVGGLLLLITGNLIIQVLYGSRFISAAPILRILLPGVIMNNSYEILYADLAGRGRPEVGLYVRLLSLCLIIVGDSILIPRWGLLGAGLVASLAQVSAGVLLTALYLHFTGQTLRQLVWLTRDDLVVLWRFARRVVPMANSRPA